MDAGIEGGSKQTIEENWSLFDYGEQAEYWAVNPPLRISMMLAAAALGVKWDKVREQMGRGVAEGPLEVSPAFGPSIAELAEGITPPKSLGGTMDASIAALRRLPPPGGRSAPAVNADAMQP